jgi:hypothetical protein
MVICKKCSAEIADGLNFCTECGEALDGSEQQVVDEVIELAEDAQTEVLSVDDNAEKKSKKQGLFKGGLFGKKGNTETDDVIDADIISEDIDIAQDAANFIEQDILDEQTDPTFEQEAEKWAKDNIESEQTADDDKVIIKKQAVEPTVINTPDTVKTTTIFTTRGRNNFSDKFLGLALLVVIAVVCIMAFVYGSGASNSGELYDMFIELSPLFIVALSGLLLARTGNIDFTPVAIMIFTYFMLINGFNEQQYYIIALYVIGGAIGVGLISGVLSATFLIPNVFTSMASLAIAFVYAGKIIDYNTIMPSYYGNFTTIYIPLALVLLAFVVTFVVIFSSRLGKPIYARKGIMNSDKVFYILTHIMAYVLAAIAGFVASINATIPIDFAQTVVLSFDYIIAMIFIICVCGASTFFDNKFMPQLIFIFAFIIWFGIDFVIANVFEFGLSDLVVILVKSVMMVVALVADRVYTRNQLPEYYNTVCVKHRS